MHYGDSPVSRFYSTFSQVSFSLLGLRGTSPLEARLNERHLPLGGSAGVGFERLLSVCRASDTSSPRSATEPNQPHTRCPTLAATMIFLVDNSRRVVPSGALHLACMT